MNIPQFRATLRALRRREAERQLRYMHAVFHAAAVCVSGKTDGFDAEAARLLATVNGAEVAEKQEKKTSPFQQLLKVASRDMAARRVPLPETSLAT